jgi:hypothetical protein
MPSWELSCESVIGTGGVSPASQSRFERLIQSPPALPGDIYSLADKTQRAVTKLGGIVLRVNAPSARTARGAGEKSRDSGALACECP